jgi:hypothetical protein
VYAIAAECRLNGRPYQRFCGQAWLVSETLLLRLIMPSRHRLGRGGPPRRRDPREHGDQKRRPGSKRVQEGRYSAERIPRGIHETNPGDRQQQPERDGDGP